MMQNFHLTYGLGMGTKGFDGCKNLLEFVTHRIIKDQLNYYCYCIVLTQDSA
jgi:hypothetical protein